MIKVTIQPNDPPQPKHLQQWLRDGTYVSDDGAVAIRSGNTAVIISTSTGSVRVLPVSETVSHYVPCDLTITVRK